VSAYKGFEEVILFDFAQLNDYWLKCGWVESREEACSNDARVEDRWRGYHGDLINFRPNEKFQRDFIPIPTTNVRMSVRF